MLQHLQLKFETLAVGRLPYFSDYKTYPPDPRQIWEENGGCVL